jgi:hypothetical protein
MDEVFELPFITKYVGHQDTVLAALFVAHLVAACHHRSDARVQAIFEMRQIVEGRALRHGAGEEGRTGARHPKRAVGEQQRRNVEAIIAAARTGGAGASDPVILRQRIDQIVHI